jgi:hypothetical protein
MNCGIFPNSVHSRGSGKPVFVQCAEPACAESAVLGPHFREDER